MEPSVGWPCQYNIYGSQYIPRTPAASILASLSMLLRRTRNQEANLSGGAKPRTTRKPPMNHPPLRPSSGGCRREAPSGALLFFGVFVSLRNLGKTCGSGSAPGDNNSSIVREQNPGVSLSRLLGASFMRFSIVWGGILRDVNTQFYIPGTRFVSIYWQYLLLCQYLAPSKSPFPVEGCLRLVWCLVP